jgi:hypothetical protein
VLSLRAYSFNMYVCVHVRDATVFGEINCVFIFISVDIMLTPKMN